VPAAILAGDAWSGVTVFQLDEGMDTGPILSQRMTPVGSGETAGALTARLAEMGGELLVDTLTAESRSPLLRVPQVESDATYARMLAKEDGRIPWNRPSEQVDRWIRAVTPWPGAFTVHAGRRLAVRSATPVNMVPAAVTPGTVVSVQNGIEVACLPGAVRLREVQQEGKRAQAAEVWARGARLEVGACLGTA
jgi:methionyl-tRNA formyltransferase